MNIKDVMNTGATLVTPSTTLKEAAEKMSRDNIGFLPVGENDQLRGTVTDRDIIIRGISQGKDPQNTAISEVLHDDLVYCNDDVDVEEAVKTMGKHQIRRLPVLNADKRLVGIVSIGDLAQHLNPETAGKVLADVTNWG